MEEAIEKQDADGPVDLQTLLNLDEIEAEATKRISKRAWAYYYSAGDDLFSKTYNNTVYCQILLRPRIFIDCTKCDLRTNLLGHNVGMPLYVSPAAMARLGHPDGEHGIQKGIEDFGAMQIISNNASQTPEEIVAGAKEGQVFGWQMYIQSDRAKSIAMLKRVHKLARIKFVVITLDAPVSGNREHDEKVGMLGKGMDVVADAQEARPSAGGVGKTLFAGTASDLTWKPTLEWARAHTHLPIVLKGLQTHEDAYLAAQYAPQVKAIILSNHGGRALDTAPPAIHTLLEIRKYCPGVLEQIEVWVDGGIKRGTDVVKALCLGAKAVGVGRAALFGLGAGGSAGVRRTFEILSSEIETCMRLLGAETVADLGPRFINTRAIERDIYDGPSGVEKMGNFGLWESLKSKL